jgi:prepilin-type N-terminal cleavage/methylation domain-containing protein
MKHNRIRSRQRGFSLIEVAIATALIGLVGVGFLAGIADTTRGTGLSDEHTMAESLARSEMEYVRQSIYVLASWSYELPLGSPSWDNGHALTSGYEGFSLRVSASPLHVIDDGIQAINITVIRDSQTVFTLRGYKTTRSAE